MPSPSAIDPASALRHRFDAQHRASREHAPATLAERAGRLRRLRAWLDANADDLCAAVQADFGVRAPALTEVADLFVLRSLLRDLAGHLARWSRPRGVATPVHLWPARAWLQPQPLGVVGVISPWNYPLQLSLGPAATALAAGNRVMLKPSELTPATSAMLAERIARDFDPDEFAVATGDASVGAAFAALPFDHLFFTGSTAVGREVALAAARHLTPTTLELGGKSPCIVDASADLDTAATRIAHGKLLNAGQTCIAPDYVLLPRGLEDAFADAWQRAVARLYPTLAEGSADYAALLAPRHAQRMAALVDEARMAGARVLQSPTAQARADAPRQFAPTLVFDPPPGTRLMEEEIFGPVLPVLPCDGAEDAVRRINARPRPLALYWFGRNMAARRRVLEGTVSGGVTLNDTLLHLVHDHLPFGGVGASGWGAYHGEAGFLRFSHAKPVVAQGAWSAVALFYPPYGERLRRVMAAMRVFFG